MVKTNLESGGRRPLRLTLLGLLVAALWCVIVSQERLQQAVATVRPSVEVDLRFLESRQGRLFRSAQGSLFTGWVVEHDRDANLVSRSQVRHGRLHGVSEGWDPNGQIQVREHFRNGVSHGLRTKWYASGQKLSEVEVVSGKLHGVFRRWHENGVLAEEVALQKGTPEGLSRAWYPNGQLKAQARLEEGKVRDRKQWKEGS